jgi:hypothetical protein
VTTLAADLHQGACLPNLRPGALIILSMYGVYSACKRRSIRRSLVPNPRNKRVRVRHGKSVGGRESRKPNRQPDDHCARLAVAKSLNGPSRIVALLSTSARRGRLKACGCPAGRAARARARPPAARPGSPGRCRGGRFACRWLPVGGRSATRGGCRALGTRAGRSPSA